MDEVNRDRLDLERLHSEIGKMIAETAKLNSETVKIANESARLAAETAKITVERSNLATETYWYPFVVAAFALGAGAALTIAFVGAFGLLVKVFGWPWPGSDKEARACPSNRRTHDNDRR